MKQTERKWKRMRADERGRKGQEETVRKGGERRGDEHKGGKENEENGSL